MRFRSRLATTVVALPLILGVAACGAQKADNSTTNAGGMPTPVVTPTAAPSKAAPPVVAHLNRVSFVPAMNSAQTKLKSWRMTGRMTYNGKLLMTMSGVQTAKPQAMSMEMAGEAFGGKSAKIVLVGKTLYMSVPGMTPAGKVREGRRRGGG